MEMIKFSNGVKYAHHGVTSTADTLKMSFYDVDKSELEAIARNEEATSIIKLINFNEETLDEKVIKGYAGYTTLVSLATSFDEVTAINYDVEDPTTESGFAEDKHDVTTLTMYKVAKLVKDVEDLKTSQSIQDEAIGDLGDAVSEIADVQQPVQDGAIEDLAEAVSSMM